MSVGEDRADLAELLSTINGIHGFQYRPENSANPGDAWPLIERMERGPANDFQVTWRVMVVMPKGERDAMEYFETRYEDVANTLADFAHVEEIEPGTVQTEAGSYNAMIVRMKKEA